MVLTFMCVRPFPVLVVFVHPCCGIMYLSILVLSLKFVVHLVLLCWGLVANSPKADMACPSDLCVVPQFVESMCCGRASYGFGCYWQI